MNMQFAPPKIGWTEERTATAIRLWEAGRSASQIAAELGGITRSGVLGKLHRMNLMLSPEERSKRIGWNRNTAKPKKEPRPKTMRAKKERPVKPPTWRDSVARNPGFDASLRTEHAISKDDAFYENKLTHRNCKWIIGDTDEPDWFYCGAPVLEGFPYCEGHCMRAYIPPREPK